LANIIAAGTGLTLDRSDTIIFMDKSFSPADNEQAQDRIVHTTEERLHPINIISFVADGTVDERINQILERKEDLTKLINRPEVFR
jgi:SNF2 family DNA or RNA helicase